MPEGRKCNICSFENNMSLKIVCSSISDKLYLTILGVTYIKVNVTVVTQYKGFANWIANQSAIIN